MKKRFVVKRIISVLLTIFLIWNTFLVCASFPNIELSNKSVNNPSEDGKANEWFGDYVYFGSFPQEEVHDQEIISSLDDMPAINGIIYYNGEKYAWVKYIGYVKFMPIKWRVLQNINGSLTLISDLVLTTSCYSSAFSGVTWANSDVRFYLNNTFYNMAFNKEEQKDILTVEVSNQSVDETYDEPNTYEKVYLPSAYDLYNTAYGFISDDSRTAHYNIGVNTATITTPNSYAFNTEKETCCYLTRTIGDKPYGYVRPVYATADGHLQYGGHIYNSWRLGVRPMINVRLNSALLAVENKLFLHFPVTQFLRSIWTLVASTCCLMKNPTNMSN